MLNQFKIGTKLFAGFGIVLLLLVGVWIMGRVTVDSVVSSYAKVMETNTLAEDGVKIQRDVRRALYASAEGIISRDPAKGDEVKEQVDNILTNFANVADRIDDTKTEAEFLEALRKVEEIKNLEADYWVVEAERVKWADRRFQYAEDFTKIIGELEQNVRDYTAKELALQQGDVEFYPRERVELLLTVAHLADHVRDIRRLCYQYGNEANNDKKNELRGDMEGLHQKIVEAVKELTPKIESPDGQAMLVKLGTDLTQWWEAVTKVSELEDKLDEITVKSDEAGTAAAAILGTVIEEFETLVSKIRKDAADFNARMQWTLIGVCAFAVLLGAVISFVLMRNIVSGIHRAVGAMRLMSNVGDVNFVIPDEDMTRKDEVGDMAQAFASLQHQFQNVEQLAISLAAGDYTSTTDVRSDKDTMNISLNKMLDQVNQTLREINTSVQHVATGSGEVSSAAQSLANGAQESAASLEEITASMSEVSSQTKKNAESAAQARDLAQQASKAASDGQEAMRNMTHEMELITTNSNEIQRVIKVIDDIAFQTNLLALNAAVEAARAGQHGKGFAVVAEEVRNLASRSAKAAKETSELIAKSGHEIDEGGKIAVKTAEVLNTIVEQIKKTTDLVAGIAIASNEQAEGVNQITIGLQQIDSVTQQNTAAAEESASAASEMSSTASSLQQLVSRFNLRKQSGGETAKAKQPSAPAPSTSAKPSASVPSTPAKPSASVPSTPAKPSASVPNAPAPKLMAEKAVTFAVTPAAKPAAAHVSPVMPKHNVEGSDPAAPIAGGDWGGGGSAEVHIDLGDKDFGKY